MRSKIFIFILFFAAGLATTSLVFAQISKSTLNKLGVPEFLYYLKIPPKVEIVGAGAPPAQAEYRYREEIAYGECPPPEPCPDCEPIPEEAYCDLDAILNERQNAYKLSWSCFGYDDCTITKNDQFFMSVAGDGFLDDIPVGQATVIALKLVSADLSCSDELTLRRPPPPPPPPPPVTCPVIQERTLVSKYTAFLNGELVSGFLPRLKFTANQAGTVNVGVTTTKFYGGPCFTPPYWFKLSDPGTVTGSRIAGPNYGATVNLGSFNVIGSSIHDLRLGIDLNCLTQSLISFGTMTTKVTGPLGPFCPIVETVSVPELEFKNNILISGSFPSYSFTAQDNERVTVDVSADIHIGGPCLTPPYRAVLFSNGLTVGAGGVKAYDGTGGWSWRFQELAVPAGSNRIIKLVFIPNCTEPPIESVMRIKNIIMTITREHP